MPTPAHVVTRAVPADVPTGTVNQAVHPFARRRTCARAPPPVEPDRPAPTFPTGLADLADRQGSTRMGIAGPGKPVQGGGR